MISNFVIVTIMFYITNVFASNMPDVVIEKCKATVPGISESAIKSMKTDPKFKTTDPNVKCFAKCIGEEMDVVDKDGKLMPDAFNGPLPPYMDSKKVKSNLESCRAKVGTNPCETAYDQWMCIIEKGGV